MVRRVAGVLWRKIHSRSHCLVVVDPQLTPKEIQLIDRACAFYGWVGLRLRVQSQLRLFDAIKASEILIAGFRESAPLWLRAFRHRGINPSQDAFAAHSWHRAVFNQLGASESAILQGKLKLQELQESLPADKGRVYVFGTGPSLDIAGGIDFSDGVRIACNTIVKNANLLEHLQPHVLVAGDALYHFSDNAHSTAFFSSLRTALHRHQSLFMYPAIYHPTVIRHLPAELHQLLVPVPVGKRTTFCASLLEHFELPNLGNVLNLLLIPAAATLGDEIMLLGFDGRFAGNVGFWRNSEENSFPNLVAELNLEYPAFREHFVPEKDPNKYVNETLGAQLQANLCALETAGKRFLLLAPSALPGLVSLEIRQLDDR